MAQAKFRGRFIWQELMTEDPAAATAFYTKLLGWHAHGSSAGGHEYTEMHAGHGHQGVAGMMKTPPGGPKPMWMPYISVDEVDPAVTQIEHLGGSVVRPAMDIPNVGRFAVVKDPQGAVFAVMKPMGPPPPPPGAPEPGEFSWMELGTSDLEAAFSFYSTVFGWDALQRHDMGPMGTYLIFGSDGLQRGGMFKATGPQAQHPAWLPYAAVADVDASAKVVTASGGHVLNGPMDVPDGGRVVQLADPAGAMFALHAQTKPKVATPPAKPAAQASAPTAPKPKPAPKPAAAAAPKPPPKPAAPAAAPKPAVATPKPAAAAPTAVPAAKKAAPKKKAVAKKAVAKKAVAKKAVAKKAAPEPAAKKAVAKKKSVAKVVKKVAKKAAKKAKPKPKPKPKPKLKSRVMKSKKDKKQKKKDKKKGKKDKKKDKAKRKK